ncbi:MULTISPECIES: hypothetical protein [Arenibacter]|uniref:hypothetical protein n=1 Tax=Arenibacter TaxID=178469 RepID=UPI001593DC2C|nr:MULTISPECIES: hypothetical protein [Arenibacter]
MNYRVKSLVYLIGFIFSALVGTYLQEDSHTVTEELTTEHVEKIDQTIVSLEKQS